MRVGLLSLGDLLADPVTGACRTHAERHRNLVEQGVAAEAAGFHSVHLGEHHFCEYILSSPQLVLAAIAERTSTLRLSTGVTLGVNNDPVRIAEDYATLDVLSGGRIQPCIGRGTFFPHTFASFGQDPRNAKAMFAENLELLVRLWEEQSVTWSGTFRAPLVEVTVTPRPMQQPRPPIWAGVGASADSIELAARLGLWLMLPTVFGRIEMFKPAVELYLQRWDHYGHDVARRRIGCVTHTFVHRISQTAKAMWEPRFRTYVEAVEALQLRSSGGSPSAFGNFDFESRVATIAMCGSPAEIVDRMGVFREELQLDTQLLMFDMGGMPDRELFECIDLVGAEVIPHVAKT